MFTLGFDAAHCRARRQDARLLAGTLCSLALSGCAQRGAPSLALFGAYFPAWMFCAIVGIVAAVGARIVFVASGLSDVLPFQLFVCVAIGACLALLAWLSWFA
jgi:hypothetical protein